MTLMMISFDWIHRNRRVCHEQFTRSSFPKPQHKRHFEFALDCHQQCFYVLVLMIQTHHFSIKHELNASFLAFRSKLNRTDGNHRFHRIVTTHQLIFCISANPVQPANTARLQAANADSTLISNTYPAE